MLFRSNSFDPLIIRIEYRCFEEITNPVFGIEIRTENDIHCFGTNTKLRKLNLGKIKGHGVINFKIENIPFLIGRYYLTVAAVSEDLSITYDWHDKLYSFSVLNPTNDSGFIAFSSRFEIAR